MEYFENRYELLETIGEGGEGRIFKAYDRAVERFVAIKELRLHNKERSEALKEARAIARISHPNVISLYDVIEEEDKVYLIMEYVEGTSLREILQESHYLDFQVALGIFIQVALAVEFAHNHGILHLDIKPENILVSKTGIVKLTDFGIARFVTEPEEAGKIMGSTHYLAPESLKGRYSISSDVFALGVILYEMLAGQNPFFSYSQEEAYKKILEFYPPPVSSIRKDVPEEFDQILAKALAKHPSRRFKDVTRFRIKVERFFEYDYPEDPVKLLFEEERTVKQVKLKNQLALRVSSRVLQGAGLFAASFFIALASGKLNTYESLLLAIPVFLVSLLTVPLGGFLSFAFLAYILMKTNQVMAIFLIAAALLSFYFLRDISRDGSHAGFAIATSFFGLESAFLSLIFGKSKARSYFSGMVLYLLFVLATAAMVSSSGSHHSVFIYPPLFKEKPDFLQAFLKLALPGTLSLILTRLLFNLFKEKLTSFVPAMSMLASGVILLFLNPLLGKFGDFLVERISISFALTIVVGFYRFSRKNLINKHQI